MGQEDIWSVIFTGADGKHVLAGGSDRRIRCWQIEDGKEVGEPMDADEVIYDIALSQDGKWIATGASRGFVKVFDAKTRKLVRELDGHEWTVNAIDVSPDGTKIVTGSDDKTVRIWTLATGRERRRLEHDWSVVAAKFSPNGLFLATGTFSRKSVRIYRTRNGGLLADFEIQVGSWNNQSVAWHQDNKHLFIASEDAHIHHIDASTGSTLSKWRTHIDDYPRCIALASDSTYIAASVDQSVYFWDADTHEQLGSPIEYANNVSSLAISTNHDMAVGVGHIIMLQDLRHIHPAHYYVTRELYNKLTDLRNRYETQLRVLRDHKIAALTIELNRRKHSVSIKMDMLAAVRQELDRFPVVSPLSGVHRDLRASKARIHEIDQRYQVQLREITLGVPQDQPESPQIVHPVADSDLYAETALTRILESLNTGIQRTSTSIATYLIRHIQSVGAEERSFAMRRASESIPQLLVDRLIRTMSRHNIASHLSIAFRAHFTSFFYLIISSWTTDERTDKLLNEVYARLLESESPAFAASWRSLAHTNMPDCPGDASGTLVSRAIRGLADIAVTADCATSASDTASKLSPKFGHNISSMVATAEKLRGLIGEALKADYRVVAVPPGQTFDENFMVVDADRGSGVPAGRRGKKVLCTTCLGLIKEAVNELPSPGPSTNTLTRSTVLRASVILQENRWG
ncbi:WD40-repeat-containing domain protein [Chiua virens]|nr:WD40-repeat-containing domain protein [Chiua virens]